MILAALMCLALLMWAAVVVSLPIKAVGAVSLAQAAVITSAAAQNLMTAVVFAEEMDPRVRLRQRLLQQRMLQLVVVMEILVIVIQVSILPMEDVGIE